MTTTKKEIPKAANCDDTLAAVLGHIVNKNDVCIALTDYDITDSSITLTYDDEKCSEAN